jgi:RNA recognition motif-containing protein
MSESKKILVLENLPLGITSSELTSMLTPLGQVSWSYIKSPEDGRLNQTAYVEMATEKEASKVIVKWNGTDLRNHVLRVKYVPPNFDRTSMGEDWRKAKPPSQKKPQSKKILETVEEKSEVQEQIDQTEQIDQVEQIDQAEQIADPLSTSPLARTANKTVQYNRKDLVVLKPGLDLNSSYDKPHSIIPSSSKVKPSTPKLAASPAKNPFTWFMAIFFIVAILLGSYLVYFFWNKM